MCKKFNESVFLFLHLVTRTRTEKPKVDPCQMGNCWWWGRKITKLVKRIETETRELLCEGEGLDEKKNFVPRVESY